MKFFLIILAIAGVTFASAGMFHVTFQTYFAIMQYVFKGGNRPNVQSQAIGFGLLALVMAVSCFALIVS